MPRSASLGCVVERQPVAAAPLSLVVAVPALALPSLPPAAPPAAALVPVRRGRGRATRGVFVVRGFCCAGMGCVCVGHRTTDICPLGGALTTRH